MNDPINDDNILPRGIPTPQASPLGEDYVIPTVVEEPHLRAGTLPPRLPRRRRLLLPVLLFIATCLTTYYVGVVTFLMDGWQYCLALMMILGCHEAGHFLQARRYGVPASLPFFIPIPAPPIGTLGAVIGMSSRITDRRALFDIGITGPLAGLVPTLICCVVGVQLSHLAPLGQHSIRYGDPLLLKLLYRWQFGPLPEGYDVIINPLLWAGWVGLLVTALNLMPIGQLDGGHVLYALVRRHAHRVAMLLLLSAVVAVVVFGYYWWTLMLVLLVIMGPKHPPTARDDVPLGFWRVVLGWLALAFIVLGFTPKPFIPT